MKVIDAKKIELYKILYAARLARVKQNFIRNLCVYFIEFNFRSSANNLLNDGENLIFSQDVVFNRINNDNLRSVFGEQYFVSD